MSQSKRKHRITATHPLSVVRQCGLLSVGRSSYYARSSEVSAQELELMNQLDGLHLKYPFMDSRRLRDALFDEHAVVVNRKRVQRLMRVMGIRALFAGKRRTSEPDAAHRKYPYLLRGLTIDRSSQVWCADITYLPMAHGYAYLVAVMDWHSRKVLSWRLSNVMDSDFCVEALNEAIGRYGTPQIFNTDQGSQFTASQFTDTLKDHQIRFSMDGKGRWMDNVFIERLWRSVKYEEVYLHGYESLNHARKRLDEYFQFYNHKRRHQTLNATPDEVYYRDLSELDLTG